MVVFQDLVHGQKTPEEFMSQKAVKLQTDQQPILLKFLETHIIYLRDFIVTGKISMREMLKPPLRQSSFTYAILTLPPQPSLSLHGAAKQLEVIHF